jgi:uncharacterized membrane protein YecN with MAPEG domain
MNLDLGLVHMPVYAGLVAAILMVLQLVLMGRVIAARGQTEVLIGSGGVESLELKTRVHANLLENAPTFMVGYALLEMMAGSTLWVAVLGGIFVLSRILHAIGFSLNPGFSPGRFIGVIGSMLATLVTAGYLAYLVIQRL